MIYWTNDAEDDAPRHEERKKTKEKIYVKEDMERVGVTEVDARFTVRWRQMIHSKDP